MDWSETFRTAVRGAALPDHFVQESFRSEIGVKNDLEVMRSRGVTVKIERAGGLEDLVKFYEAARHHHQVGEHVVRAEKVVHGLNGFRNLDWCPSGDERGVLGLCLLAPVP